MLCDPSSRKTFDVGALQVQTELAKYRRLKTVSGYKSCLIFCVIFRPMNRLMGLQLGIKRLESLLVTCDGVIWKFLQQIIHIVIVNFNI